MFPSQSKVTVNLTVFDFEIAKLKCDYVARDRYRRAVVHRQRECRMLAISLAIDVVTLDGRGPHREGAAFVGSAERNFGLNTPWYDRLKSNPDRSLCSEFRGLDLDELVVLFDESFDFLAQVGDAGRPPGDGRRARPGVAIAPEILQVAV